MSLEQEIRELKEEVQALRRQLAGQSPYSPMPCYPWPTYPYQPLTNPPWTPPVWYTTCGSTTLTGMLTT